MYQQEFFYVLEISFISLKLHDKIWLIVFADKNVNLEISFLKCKVDRKLKFPPYSTSVFNLSVGWGAAGVYNKMHDFNHLEYALFENAYKVISQIVACRSWGEYFETRSLYISVKLKTPLWAPVLVRGHYFITLEYTI